MSLRCRVRKNKSSVTTCKWPDEIQVLLGGHELTLSPRRKGLGNKAATRQFLGSVNPMVPMHEGLGDLDSQLLSLRTIHEHYDTPPSAVIKYLKWAQAKEVEWFQYSSFELYVNQLVTDTPRSACMVVGSVTPTLVASGVMTNQQHHQIYGWAENFRLQLSPKRRQIFSVIQMARLYDRALDIMSKGEGISKVEVKQFRDIVLAIFSQQIGCRLDSLRGVAKEDLEWGYGEYTDGVPLLLWIRLRKTKVGHVHYTSVQGDYEFLKVMQRYFQFLPEGAPLAAQIDTKSGLLVAQPLSEKTFPFILKSLVYFLGITVALDQKLPDGYTWHSFRCTFAVHSFWAGIPLEAICHKGDWSSPKILWDYICSAPEQHIAQAFMAMRKECGELRRRDEKELQSSGTLTGVQSGVVDALWCPRISPPTSSFSSGLLNPLAPPGHLIPMNPACFINTQRHGDHNWSERYPASL